MWSLIPQETINSKKQLFSFIKAVFFSIKPKIDFSQLTMYL